MCVCVHDEIKDMENVSVMLGNTGQRLSLKFFPETHMPENRIMGF